MSTCRDPETVELSEATGWRPCPDPTTYMEAAGLAPIDVVVGD
jgi:hypothetical protein